MTGLGSNVAPIGRNRTNDHTVAGLEVPHFTADHVHDSDRLVAECEILPWTDRPADGMRIRRADQGAGCLDNRVVWPWRWYWFVHETDCVDGLHDERAHGADCRHRRRAGGSENSCHTRTPLKVIASSMAARGYRPGRCA